MKVVCNASPLITLAKAGLLDNVGVLFERIVVPHAVATEVLAGGPGDAAAQALDQAPWLEQVRLDPPVSNLATVHLGRGEAEVIEWALRKSEYTALLDDRSARRVAASLGVRCVGTLGVLFEAAQRNLLPSFPEAVARLRAVGLYCDERTLEPVTVTIAG